MRLRHLLYALAFLPGLAQAATYTFSGTSFPTCPAGWSQAGSTWTCAWGNVSLSAGDKILPASGITVKVNANFSLPGNNTIGTATTTVNLSTDYGALTLGNSGGATTVYGNLSTSSGAISLTGAIVNGSVTTSGTLTTSGGSVSGNVSASNGVTATNGTVFGGNVTANTGSVSLNGSSVAGAVHSNCCTVTTTNTNVGNGVSSNSSTVTINGGTVSGTISTSGGSGVVINNATVASGSIVTSNVAIRISGSTLGSPGNQVNVTSSNTVTITGGSTIYGSVTAASWQNSNTVVDSTSAVHGVCTSSTNSTNDPDSYGNRCDGGVTGSTTTVKFNACHNYSSGNCVAASGRLYTRLAGTAFSADVVALKSDGSVDTSFDKKATVTLIARSATGGTDANNCFAADYSQTLDNAATAFTSGRLTLNSITVNAAYPDVRIKVACDSANCATAIAGVCSGDNFAIRPSGFTVSSTDANADGSGASTDATPRIRAGGDSFTLSAAAIAGYNGTPKVNTAALAAHAGAAATGTLTGSFSQATNGTATGNGFSYSEVGYFRFGSRGVYDDTFTTADQSAADCINSTDNAADYSNVLDSGKYGCKFGNTAATAYFGRFIPHHFDVTGNLVTRSDLQVAEGQATPFTYMDEPMQLTLTVTPYAAADGVTRNYSGGYAKLDTATLGNGAGWFNTGCAIGTQCMGIGAVNNAVTGLSGRLAATSVPVPPGPEWDATTGIGTFRVNLRLARAAAPDGPYDALDLGALPHDSDGVEPPAAMSADAHRTDLDATAGNTLAGNPDGTAERRRVVAGTRARFGRLRLVPTQCSPRVPCSVNLSMEYWDGIQWAVNTLDSLAPLAAANLSVSGLANVVAIGAFAGGWGRLTLQPTGATGTATLCAWLNTAAGKFAAVTPACVAATSAARAYLEANWGGATYDYDAAVPVVFGSSRPPGGFLYRRENY